MLWIPVDRSCGKPLIRQVYDQVRTHITCGVLRAGDRLPSSRELAADLHVSRNVVLEAYDQLLAEGYIESRPGSGMYVVEGTYLADGQQEQVKHFEEESIPDIRSGDIIDFRPGVPALDLFPRKVWSKLAQLVYLDAPPTTFGYDTPEGRPELRSALARYLQRTRGIRCHAGQIVITAGAAQAFSLLGKLLLSPDSEIITEDPGMHEVQTIYTSYGASLYPITVDEHGIQADLLPGNKQPACIYLTPSHQFPLGSILSIQRRVQLLQYARASGCYILEDDYDSEFRYTGSPINSLQGLDPERVIYIGTFSKIISPALRLGYMILPPPLIQVIRHLKRLNDLHSPSLDQLILARFIDEGHLERHIMKMKRVYRQRRNTLIASLNAHFADRIAILGDATGLHIVAAFPHVDFTDPAIEAAMQRARIHLYPVEAHAIRKGHHRHQVILGYGNLSNDEIVEGVRRLADMIRSSSAPSLFCSIYL